MGTRTAFVKWSALLLVAMSLALTVESLHFHHRSRAFHPVLRRGCGRTNHGGAVRERTISLFEVGQNHEHQRQNLDGNSHHLDRNYPLDRENADRKFDQDDHHGRHEGMRRTDRVDHHDQHDDMGKTVRLDRSDRLDGTRKAHLHEHSERQDDVRESHLDGHSDRQDGMWKVHLHEHFGREAGLREADLQNRPDWHGGLKEFDQRDHSEWPDSLREVDLQDVPELPHGAKKFDGENDPDGDRGLEQAVLDDLPELPHRPIKIDRYDQSEGQDELGNVVVEELPHFDDLGKVIVEDLPHFNDLGKVIVEGLPHLHKGVRKVDRHGHPDRHDGKGEFNRHDHHGRHDGTGKSELHDDSKRTALSKFRRYVHRVLDVLWAWKNGGFLRNEESWRIRRSHGFLHRKKSEGRDEIFKAKEWPTEFTINFTTKLGAATGFLAYDWSQKRQVIYHGPNSTYCANFGTENDCQMMEISGGTYVYIPSLEQCSLVVEGVGSLPPDWTTFSEYVGTQEFLNVGKCRAFAFPPTAHVYYETVQGGLPCAFVFPDPSMTYYFRPETFEVGTTDEKFFDFPDNCLSMRSPIVLEKSSISTVLDSSE